MALEDLDNESVGSEMSDKEAEVDLEGELVSASEEIDRPRQKEKKQEKLLINYEKNYNDATENIIHLNIEL